MTSCARVALAAAVALPLAGQALPLALDRLRLPAGLPPAVDCLMADLDGDGLADLLRAFEQGVHVLVQRPGGSFAPHPTQPLIAYPGRVLRSIAFGGFQVARAAQDLVVGFQTGPAEVLWQSAGGTFTPSPLPLPAPIAPLACVLPFDHDRSRPDDLLLVPEQGRPQILLGQIDGSHRDASQLFSANLVLQSPRMAFADVDGDGDGDLVVASPLLSAPFVLENGSGGFLQQRPLPVRSACSAVAVADMDRDGRADLVFARSAPLPAGIEFVLLTASGPVAHVLASPLTLEQPAPVLVVADVDGNGAADVLAMQADGRVRLGLSDGLPRFAMTSSLAPLEPGPRAALAAADADADGVLDVYAPGSRAADAIVRDSFLLGRGGGALFDTEAVSFPIGALPAAPIAGAAVDLDGDLEADLLAFGDGRAFAYGNMLGTAQFRGLIAPLPITGLRGIVRVQRVSIDTPGRDVLAVADLASGTATPPGIRLFAAQGTLYRDITTRLPASVQVGFLDAVALPVLLSGGVPRAVDDLVLADPSRGLVLLANGSGTLTEVPGAFQPMLPPEPVQRLLAADVNGDRRSDLVAIGFGGQGTVLHVYLRGATNTAPLFVARSIIAGSPRAADAVLGDADGDGRADVLLAVSGAAARPLALLLGDGSGSFHDATAARLPAALAGPFEHVAILRGRGAPPALLAGSRLGGLTVLAGDGTGAFRSSRQQPLHGSNRVRGLVVADLDTDGDDDCAVLVEDSHPALLLGTDLQIAQAGVTTSGRTLHVRVRGPAPAAVAAWFWSPVPARMVFSEWGVLRLAPPLTSLAVFPFGPGQVQDITFPTPPAARDLTLYFQLAVFDPRDASLRLSNLETALLLGR